MKVDPNSIKQKVTNFAKSVLKTSDIFPTKMV